MKRAISGLLLVAAPATANAQALWQKAERGMSLVEVQSLYPAASSPENVSTLASGARCELSISPYEFGSMPYRLCFYFSGEELDQVTLGSLDPSPQAFAAIIDLLRTMYGPEIGSGKPLCDRMTGICKAEWSLDSGVNASAIFVLLPMVPPTININYRSAVSQ